MSGGWAMRDQERRMERGHLMVGLMAGVAILLIFSVVAEQVWQDVLRRDLEAEMIFRAQDIVRALKIYRAEHGGQLPLELKAMMDAGPGGRYCLRKLWKDPLVKDGKWGLLFATPQGAIFDPDAPQATDASGTGGAGGLGSALDSGLQKMQRQQQEERQQQQGLQVRPQQGGGFSTGLAAGGGDVTGLPIAGVKSLCKKKPFRILNDQEEYALWYFTVFDMTQNAPGGAGGGLPTGPGLGGVPGAGRGGAQFPGGQQPSFGKGGRKGQRAD
jgi:hypothetical protein